MRMGTVTFISPAGEQFELEAQPGVSVMQLATSQALPGIVAECGGSLSCATCHVYVDETWYAQVGGPSATEQSMLEFAEDPGATSRLSCQIRYTDALDGLIVRIPERQ